MYFTRENQVSATAVLRVVFSTTVVPSLPRFTNCDKEPKTTWELAPAGWGRILTQVGVSWVSFTFLWLERTPLPLNVQRPDENPGFSAFCIANKDVHFRTNNSYMIFLASKLSLSTKSLKRRRHLTRWFRWPGETPPGSVIYHTFWKRNPSCLIASLGC